MRVTVIPEDQIIIVDNEALSFPFTANPGIHAIQWQDAGGVIERKVGDPLRATLADVQPFITAFNAEKQRRAAIPPPVPVPAAITVSPWQIRKALNAAGLRDAIETAIYNADQTTQDAWQYATEFRRDNPLVNQMGAILGKSEQEIDALFEMARTL